MNQDTFKLGFTNLSGADLAKYLKRSFTTDEDMQADALIRSCEAQLVSQCNRQFDTTQTYTDYFDLSGRRFWTYNFPIDTIETIELNDEELELTENIDYWLYSTHIEFNETLTSDQPRKALRIDYTIKQFWSDDIKLLILKLAGHAWLDSENAGLETSDFSFASVRQTFDLPQFKSEVKSVIDRYRKRLA